MEIIKVKQLIMNIPKGKNPVDAIEKDIVNIAVIAAT